MVQKIDTMNCTPKLLFLATAHIEHEIAWTCVQGEDKKEFTWSILANLANYFTLTSVFDIHSESQYSMNNRDQWEDLGIATKSLYHEQRVEGLDADGTDDIERPID